MKFSKKKIFLTIGAAVLLLMGGCGKEKKLDELNITYVKSPLNVPSILEKNLNIFDKEFEKDGITVKFHNLTTGPEQTQALAAGELDILHALGGTSAILAASNTILLQDLSRHRLLQQGSLIFFMLLEELLQFLQHQTE